MATLSIIDQWDLVISCCSMITEYIKDLDPINPRQHGCLSLVFVHCGSYFSMSSVQYFSKDNHHFQGKFEL